METIKRILAITIVVAANLLFWIVVDFKGFWTMILVPVGMYSVILIFGWSVMLYEKLFKGNEAEN